MADFDFDAQPEVSADTVLSVADAMGQSPRLSDDERELQRLEVEALLFAYRQRDEQQRLESERRQAERRALAEQKAAVAAAQARQRAQAEFRERMDRDTRRRKRESEISDLRRRANQHDIFARNIEAAAQRAAVQRAYKAKLDSVGQILAAIDSRMNPPPESEG